MRPRACNRCWELGKALKIGHECTLASCTCHCRHTNCSYDPSLSLENPPVCLPHARRCFGSQPGGFPHHRHLQWEAPRVRIHSSTHTYTESAATNHPCHQKVPRSPSYYWRNSNTKPNTTHTCASFSLSVCVWLSARVTDRAVLRYAGIDSSIHPLRRD